MSTAQRPKIDFEKRIPPAEEDDLPSMGGKTFSTIFPTTAEHCDKKEGIQKIRSIMPSENKPRVSQPGRMGVKYINK